MLVLLLVLTLFPDSGQRLLNMLMGQMLLNSTSKTTIEPTMPTPSSTFFNTTSAVRLGSPDT